MNTRASYKAARGGGFLSPPLARASPLACYSCVTHGRDSSKWRACSPAKIWLTSRDQEKAPRVTRPQHNGDANSETINELTPSEVSQVTTGYAIVNTKQVINQARGRIQRSEIL